MLKRLSTILLMSSSLGLVLPALAQTEAEAPATETVTVSGSRIVSNGFQAPTPVTAISTERLLERAPSNIPDALNQLPQFRGSTSNSTSATWNANSPAQAQGNYLNLRNLGINRTLVLLDGVRVPATNYSGAVDINTIPQGLVQRVDVVTGGASAAYGSDAVVGAVNFILDKSFTGFKGSIQGGISSYGDDASYKASFVAGTSFDGGRGHIEGAFEHYYSDGIHNINKRPGGGSQITNVGLRNAAVPGITYQNLRFLKLSTGGTIVGGPLNLNQFQPDGSIRPVDTGQPTVDPTNFGVGGSGGYFGGSSLTSRLRTDQLFARASYDFLPNLRGHLQVSATEAANKFNVRYDDRFAAAPNGITIFNDNAYLQPSVLAAMNAGHITSFQMGRIGNDMPRNVARIISGSGMVNAGLDGDVSIFGKNWRWNVDYVFGQTLQRTSVNENNNRRFYAAIDAVKDPNGKIVCRVTLTNPNLLPGCVPMNIFGAGSPSQDAIKYTQWNSQFHVQNSTSLLSGNFAGDLFELPAGMLSVAMGAEARRQTLREDTNSDPALAASVDYTGIKGVPAGVLISDFTNQGAARGAVNVNEGYLELDVPVVKDLPLIQSFALNGAARYTEYSSSGAVTTWKLGANWQVYDDLRVRATLSRDIAAPSNYQLYAGQNVNVTQAPDIHTNQVVAIYPLVTGGNPSLKPEKAQNFTAGVVFSPSWLPGFTTSVDYYRIVIKGAIATTNVIQQIFDCEVSNGTAPICATIIRPLPFSDRSAANVPSAAILLAQNQAVALQEGWDLEAAYHFSLADIIPDWEGEMDLHSYLSWTTANTSQQSFTAPFLSTNGADVNAKVKVSLEAIYTNGPLSIRVGERDTGATVRSYIRIFGNYANEPDRWYTDVNISYKLDDVGFMQWMGGREIGKEIFLNAENLFDAKPPLISDCCNPGLQYPTDRVKYDVIGPYFTIGLRVRL